MLKKNMSTSDRFIRIFLGAVIGILYWQGIISGQLAVILGVVSAIFIITGFVSYCPAYGIFGWKTIRDKVMGD